MEFVKVLALRGPNIWAYFPVIEAWVDLGELKDCSSDSVPGFNDRLMNWLPGMIEHRCSVGERGGFFERLRRGTYPAHILEHVTIELQSLAGSPVGYGRARESSTEGIYKVVFKYKDETLARACLAAARELVLAAIHDRPFDLPSTVARLRSIGEQNLMCPGTDAIVQAARARNIPFLRLNTGSLVQLGTGSRQRRVRAAAADSTGAIAEGISQDRALVQRLLLAAGIPVAEGHVADDREDAWETAEIVGLPAMVRPAGPGRERVVIHTSTTREEVISAYDAALRIGPSVLVERFVPGDSYRLLIVGGKLAAASRVEPATAMAASTAIDVTDLVHPGTAEHAILAAKLVGLDIAGVDIIASDIATPLEAQGGAILKIHASPDLRMHLSPAVGDSRPVGKAIVDMLFAPGDNGRIPIAAITGTNGKTTVSRFLAHILEAPGRCVGMSCTDGVYLNGKRIIAGDCSGPISARNLLMHPHVDTAVLETARGGILRAGLAFNECQVAVVTNIGEGDHLGINDMNTPEDLAKVKRGIVEVVSKEGAAVLNATDPLVAGMAARCPGSVIYFGADRANPVINDHLAAGGRAVFVNKGQLMLATGDREEALLPIGDVPLTQSGRIAFEVENTLAATAAAWAMGVPVTTIAERLCDFASDLDKVPSRFNIMEYRGATVIIDYGHNSHALRALIDALQSFPQARRVAVFSSSGDRRDADIILMGELLGHAFDRVILYEDNDRYTRQPGEITRLLREGLATATRTSKIESVDGGLQALEHALLTIEPGDLLVAQAHLSDPTVRFLQEFLAKPTAGGG